jgi:hypothetical protein
MPGWTSNMGGAALPMLASPASPGNTSPTSSRNWSTPGPPSSRPRRGRAIHEVRPLLARAGACRPRPAMAGRAAPDVGGCVRPRRRLRGGGAHRRLRDPGPPPTGAPARTAGVRIGQAHAEHDQGDHLQRRAGVDAVEWRGTAGVVVGAGELRVAVAQQKAQLSSSFAEQQQVAGLLGDHRPPGWRLRQRDGLAGYRAR